MTKTEIFEKTLYLHKAVAKKFHKKIVVCDKDSFVINGMGYDKVSTSYRDLYEKYRDYTRYRTLELVAQEIRNSIDETELNSLCMAEAGVFTGDFSWMLNYLFPQNELYLYDTFEGFDNAQVEEELGKSYTNKKYMDQVIHEYTFSKLSAEQKIESVKQKMKAPDRCHIRKGLFPDTIGDERDKRFFLVSLDMDLYSPIKAGLEFFLPRITEGGYIFLHDYNNKGFNGIKKAVEEVKNKYGKLAKTPLSDEGGSVILQRI